MTAPPPRLEISDFLDLEDRAAGGKIFGVFRHESYLKMQILGGRENF